MRGYADVACTPDVDPPDKHATIYLSRIYSGDPLGIRSIYHLDKHVYIHLDK